MPFVKEEENNPVIKLYKKKYVTKGDDAYIYKLIICLHKKLLAGKDRIPFQDLESNS